jgi:hypothetical protein
MGKTNSGMGDRRWKKQMVGGVTGKGKKPNGGRSNINKRNN